MFLECKNFKCSRVVAVLCFIFGSQHETTTRSRFSGCHSFSRSFSMLCMSNSSHAHQAAQVSNILLIFSFLCWISVWFFFVLCSCRWIVACWLDCFLLVVDAVAVAYIIPSLSLFLSFVDYGCCCRVGSVLLLLLLCSCCMHIYYMVLYLLLEGI